MVNDYLTSLEAYNKALSELRELIDRYSNESTESRLNGLFEKYEGIIQVQTEQLNKHIGKYSLPITVN